MGGFLVRWCSQESPLGKLTFRALASPPDNIAIVPDDMLAVQELHMAREGMISESICMRCRAPGVQPISTAADSQRHETGSALLLSELLLGVL